MRNTATQYAAPVEIHAPTASALLVGLRGDQGRAALDALRPVIEARVSEDAVAAAPDSATVAALGERVLGACWIIDGAAGLCGPRLPGRLGAEVWMAALTLRTRAQAAYFAGHHAAHVSDDAAAQRDAAAAWALLSEAYNIVRIPVVMALRRQGREAEATALLSVELTPV